MEACTTKQEVRQQVQCLLAQLSCQDRAQASAAITQSLLALPAIQQANCLGLFASASDEVDTTALFHWAIAAGKRVVFPRITDPATRTMEFAEVSALAVLVAGPYGIFAPGAEAPRCEKLAIDCLCLPGLSFDSAGMRLGRGSGYYDRWLEGYLGPRIAVAFEPQLVPRLPSASWDEPMDIIVTERRTIVCRAALNSQLRSAPSKEVL